jgi:hypothetical protein
LSSLRQASNIHIFQKGADGDANRAMMRRAFFDPSIEWRSSVLRQGLDAHAGAIAHLAAE